VESEKEKENLLVLEAIKFLGERGALDANEGSGDGSDDNSDGGGREQLALEAKEAGVESRDEEDLPGLDALSDKADQENHVKKEGDEGNHTVEGDGGRDGRGDMVTGHKEDKVSVTEEHPKGDNKKDDISLGQGK
jgi:hypothetical protein